MTETRGGTSTPAAERLLREMFEQMVVRKDITAIPRYHHPDFLLYTNGTTQDYEAYTRGHETVYASPITYRIRYDEDSWVSTEDRVAVRVWITTERPGERATEIEVVLIATCRDGLLYRLWELTWPDWSTLPAFEDY